LEHVSALPAVLGNLPLLLSCTASSVLFSPCSPHSQPTVVYPRCP
jgi:hypothetical protein